MNKEVLAGESTKQADELGEDIEVVGPGLMLSEARKKLSLSTEEVSKRLNFRRNLVEEIEQDIFSQSLPATFNRGYLRSYAKLVAVDADEVLSAYDMLGVAEKQRSEMQSFSNLTVKQVEHSRLMWFSYLIAALLVGLMVLWWLQDTKLAADFFENQQPEQQTSSEVSNTTALNVGNNTVEAPSLPKPEPVEPTELESVASVQKTVDTVIAEPRVELAAEKPVVTTPVPTLEEIPQIATEKVPDISTGVFTFSGDCWVNIYDATGERVAWGVKKSGYVMTVSGKAPLKVTIGKPELVLINFNGKKVDLSSFNVGNIAKFTLPLSAQ